MCLQTVDDSESAIDTIRDQGSDDDDAEPMSNNYDYDNTTSE